MCLIRLQTASGDLPGEAMVEGNGLGAVLKADKRMGEAAKEELSPGKPPWGCSRWVPTDISIPTSLGCVVFLLGTWHFQLHSCAGGRPHSPALFPDPLEEAQKDSPRDAAHYGRISVPFLPPVLAGKTLLAPAGSSCPSFNSGLTAPHGK